MGLQDKLYLGNLNAKRDWGHAKDYVKAMWLMLQQDTPEDFVIATGITTEVREFVRMAFKEAGYVIDFKGKEENETGFIVSCDSNVHQIAVGTEVVAVDPRYYRPTEVELLIGDPTKAKTKLGWEPEYNLDMLVKEMVQSDKDLFAKEKLLKDSGFQVKNQYE